ncbi:YbhB/YbcL family Raf kinase inhibitor-like protein [Candidatus Woesearchaeota archaeon]|nr:YbhB/YbcL family Raf kinase inhibitor-like protein [Candidatus Woesearchaeota archaeon]
MNETKNSVAIKRLEVTSSAFKANSIIPMRYTCDGEDISPELRVTGLPEGVKSLALIVDDPDAPRGIWVHWVVWNINADEILEIKEGSVPGIQGINDFGKHEYGGPCPPFGVHRYFFKVYALDTEVNLEMNAGKTGLEEAMEGHILAKGELIGLFGRGEE